MTEQWGRLDTAGIWPRPRPVWTIGLLLIAILSGAAMDAYRYTAVWTPLQRIYLKPYIRSTSASALRFETSQYQLLYVTDRQAITSRDTIDDHYWPRPASGRGQKPTQ
jgi:hypothetical protein